MPTINRPLSVIREMTIDAMRDYEEHTKQEVVEIIEKKSETQLSKIEKGYVSTVLRTYAGIFKSFREHRPIVFKLSQAQQHNVVLKTRMQDVVNELSDLRLQLENVKLEREFRATSIGVVKTKCEITKARLSQPY